jgi:hypothetical protein
MSLPVGNLNSKTRYQCFHSFISRAQSSYRKGSTRSGVYIPTALSKTAAGSSRSLVPPEHDLRLGRTALLSAVEDHGSASPRPLLHLFAAEHPNRKSVKSGLSLREQKQLLLQAVQHLGKAPARRFFAGVSDMLESVLENEDYIPESAYQGQ